VVTLDLARLPEGDWWRGLLLFLARDLIEGELALGWGKSRGFGACRAVLMGLADAEIDSFTGLLATLREQQGAQTPTQWITALHVKVAQAIQSAGNGDQR
jgi:hypothetical protein